MGRAKATEKDLTGRVRAALSGLPDVVEKRMFGGTAFMVRGSMCITARDARLMCRVDPTDHDDVVAQPGASGVTMKGRVYRGYVHVDADAVKSAPTLHRWVKRALEFNEALTRRSSPAGAEHSQEGRKHMTKKGAKSLGSREREALLAVLKTRFEEHMHRHSGLQWEKVRTRLDSDPGKLWSLSEMERSGGEPDVAGHDRKTGEYIFVDCSAESPKGRRSVCYDREALDARKKNKPEASAVELAAAMGAALLTEEEYRELQDLDEFDAKTSSWLETPPDIRKLGGAMFGDYRFGKVWVYHNGADSYYAARGFRCALRV